MSRSLRILALLAALLVVCVVAGSSLVGQAPTSRALGPIAEEFDQLHFRSIGPASMSGRITDFAVYEANPAIYYVATSHGGVWKTTSNGSMYEAQFQDKGEMSIGDVAISQTNPDLVWVGTGESNNRQSVSWGSGVYKSTDGGKTYQLMGLPNSKHINRLAIDPTNENVVLVAATGPLFGSGGERGIFKTTDGGRTWKQTLKVDDDTGANDVMIAESDPRVVYASTYQRRRSQCCFNGGGPGSGIWKSTDGGETWTRLTNGLPAGNLGRIGLDVFRRSANLVYASVEGEAAGGGGRGAGGGGGRGGAPDAAAGGRGAGGAAGAAGAGAGATAAAAQAPPGRGAGAGAGAPAAAGAGAGGAGPTGLYRSDDGGATWRRVSAVNPRPMYFSKVRIDPNNPDRVYMGGVGLQMTIDGGRTMETDAALVTHDDVHAIWVNPANSNHIVIGNDGGVYKSYDMAKTWQFMPNLPLALFYHASYDMEIPFNVCGGLQDNYNWCGPSATRSTRGIRNADWFQVQGGDGFVTIIDQRDSRIVFTESQDGNMSRKNKVTGESKSIRPTAANVVNLEAGAAPFRFHWDTPMMFSPHDPGVLIAAANRVFRSTDRGDSWTVISPDLTSNADRGEIITMGVRGADVRIATNDGIASWPTIVSIAESPKQPGLYYTGTDDGTVSMTRDGGKTWQNITDRLSGYPKGAWTSEVVPSRFDAGTVYITSDGHRLNDYETYMWVSTDFGATFRSLNGNLKGEVVRTLTEDTKNADVLYAGTETGIFLTLDRGKSWRRLKGNLPTVRIDELTIHPRDNALLIGTHGRAMWILDHLEPIQEYAAAQAASNDAKLFSVPTALQWRSKDEQNDEFWGHQFFVGENPPFDAMIQFHLKKPVGELRLKISDAAGKEVRDLLIPANRNAAGVQTVCWDMRMQPIAAPGAGGAAAGAGRGGGGGAGGPGGGRGGAPAVPGVPMPLPPSGSNPANPCGGGAGGGGGFGGGGGAAAPLVLPGTYSVALLIDGKTVDTKPMRVIADPSLQLTDVQRKRYQDVVVDLHDLQKRGTDMTAALMPLHNEMTEIAGKIGGMGNVPEAVKTQFVAANTEFAAIRAKFGVPPPQGGAAGGRGGGGGGGGGRGGGAPDENVVTRASTVKGQILAFQEMPSDYLLKAYNDVKLALPKAVADANAFLVKAMTLSQVLKKHDITLNVPAPVK